MYKISCLFAAFSLGVGLNAAAADKTLGDFRDWSAMQYGADQTVACMAFTQPVQAEAKGGKRGEAFVFVTHRPASGERDRISVETGYPFKTGSVASIEIGALKLALSTRGSTAWLEGQGKDGDPGDADGKRLIQAMRAGSEMMVSGTSKSGQKTTDRYSLSGFTAAHTAISKRCKAK